MVGGGGGVCVENRGLRARQRAWGGWLVTTCVLHAERVMASVIVLAGLNMALSCLSVFLSFC